ncbi:unnamed protein product [Ilex paraguariensis]|uniref:Pyrrolo-quinoline quinone repeat domain-containing protein n=1 Tax=Ilex paraguariensis TaxID=185542 RepID=A0ABC8TRX1_9AQUA
MKGLLINPTDISATPAVANGAVYFPSWNGYLYAVNAFNGTLIWKQNVGELTGLPGTGTVVNVSVSRATPTVAGNLFYSRNLWTCGDNGGRLGGYAGAAIWGSIPAINIARGIVYSSTGNLYTAPPEVLRGQEAQNNQTRPSSPDRCIGPDVNFNSILAFDIGSGKIVWSEQLGGNDIFYFACSVPNNPDCPPGPILDADFGKALMLLSIFVNGTMRKLVVAVQKSGCAWALDRDNGNIVWFKLAGPGGNEGGGTWGAATDGKRVYTNIANSNRESFTLAPSTQTTTAGAWVVLDANTGQILWSTANPSNDMSQGPVSLADGVLFAGSVAPNGPLYAMDSKIGTILWSFTTGATIYGGVSASYGCIYLGNGYTVGPGTFHPSWTPGTSLYVFCIA